MIQMRVEAPACEIALMVVAPLIGLRGRYRHHIRIMEKDNGNYYNGLYRDYHKGTIYICKYIYIYWGYIGTMEKKLETTILYWGSLANWATSVRIVAKSLHVAMTTGPSMQVPRF